MTTEQWFWVVLIILNSICVGVRITFMAQDGARRMDHVMLAGGAMVIAVGLLNMAGVA